MAIDPQIPFLATRAVSLPPQSLSAVYDVQKQRQDVALNTLKLDDAERARAEAEQMRAVLAEAGGDLSEETLNKVMTVAPGAGMKLREEVAKNREVLARAVSKEAETSREEFQRGAAVLGSVLHDPSSYTRTRAMLLARNDDLGKMLLDHPTFDANVVQSILRAGTTANEQVEATQKFVEGMQKGDYRYLAGALAAAEAQGPEELAAMVDAITKSGAPQAVIDVLRTNPRALSQTEQERQTIAGQAEGRQIQRENMEAQAASRAADDARQSMTAAETARHNRAVEAASLLRAQRTGMGGQSGRSGVTWSDKLDPALANLADAATFRMPGTQAPRYIALINRLAEQGNTAEVKRMIKQGAIENELADDKRQITGRGDAAAALDSIRTGLRELKAAGVNTNLLRGGVEDAARALGTSTDPRLVRVSTQIRDAFITYRRALTGVAFGAAEGADYEKLFPNYRNTLPTNEAILDGLAESFKTRDRAYWTRKFGPEGAALVGAIEDMPTSPSSPTAPRNATPVGGRPQIEVKAPNGKTYAFDTVEKAEAFKRRAGIP